MNLLNHKAGRGLVAFAFYFAEGVPIGFIWWAMPTLLRQQGVSNNEIGSFAAILTLPWVFKFLWAPLMDIFRSPRFGYKHWMGTAQLFMCLSLIPLLFISLKGNIFIWGGLLFFHSLCAATQDVAIDALVINTVAHHEKGMMNGYMQSGMLVARSLFGGGALVIAASLGIHATVACMILAILASMSLLPMIKSPYKAVEEKNRSAQFRSHFKTAFSSRRTWYGIGFALTAAAAFEATGAFAGPFLTDMQIDQKTIGYFYAFHVVITMLLGGLAGGFLSDKLKRKTAVAIFLSGVVITVATIALLAMTQTKLPGDWWIILLSIMYFFTGMFTTASYALFMDITDASIGATQFSTYMAATNACESWVVFAAGFIVATHGYHWAFLLMCAVSLGSLVFLRNLKTDVNDR